MNGYTKKLLTALRQTMPIVVQGDTLCDPYDLRRTPKERIMRTPMNMGALI